MNRVGEKLDPYSVVRIELVQTELPIPLKELQGGDRALALSRLRLSQKLLISAGAADKNLLTDPDWQTLLETATAIINRNQKV